MAFTTPSYSLPDLFARINRGELQLPDFQRNYSWEIDRIRSLVATVLRGYPIGALLALDTRNEPMRFKPRPLQGAPETGREPGLLLLDGQQRLTSLYHCFQGDGYVNTVDFRHKRITRRFYVDVQKAVESDILPDEAVFSVDEHGRVMSHFVDPVVREDQVGSGAEEESSDCQVDQFVGCVPVDSLLGQSGTDVLFDMAADADPELREAIKRFHHDVVAPLAAYDIPMIRLGRETARAGIGSIFAQANSAGLQMDVFELLTAMYGTEDSSFSLSETWKSVRARLDTFPVLESVDRTDFLSTLSLVVTAQRGRPGGMREDILAVSLSDFTAHLEGVLTGFERAAAFLEEARIVAANQVPYASQLVPLAAILAQLGEIPTGAARDRLNRWFWCGVLGELYGSSAVSIRAGRDVAQVTQWVRNETAETPRTVQDATFNESRLLSLDETSGVWRGIYALLMARGAKDWRTGKEFTAEGIRELLPSFEPIFPLNWCDMNAVDPLLAASVLNRTPMGKRTEVVLSGYSPARYLPRVQAKSIMEDDEFDAVLASHELEPSHLFGVDVEGFFADRRERIVGLIEHAMDRPVTRDLDDDDLHSGDEGPRAFAG